VVIAQPNRKAFASTAQYTSNDERVVLRGNPARVEDTEQGTSQGAELVMLMNDNRIFGVGKTPSNPAGRVRSSYKVKTQ
jgi:lipopolysaccharide export system protein LptA